MAASDGCPRVVTTMLSGSPYCSLIDSLDSLALAVSIPTRCNVAVSGIWLKHRTNSLARSRTLGVGRGFGTPTQIPEEIGSLGLTSMQLLSPQFGLWGDTSHSAFSKRAVRRSAVSRTSLLPKTQILTCTFCPLNWRMEFVKLSSRLPYSKRSRGPCSNICSSSSSAFSRSCAASLLSSPISMSAIFVYRLQNNGRLLRQ
jgi:hypothetical protein